MDTKQTIDTRGFDHDTARRRDAQRADEALTTAEIMACIHEGYDLSIDNVLDLAGRSQSKRYRGAALLALKAGKTAEAQVFATLSESAAIEDIRDAYVVAADLTLLPD